MSASCPSCGAALAIVIETPVQRFARAQREKAAPVTKVVDGAERERKRRHETGAKLFAALPVGESNAIAAATLSAHTAVPMTRVRSWLAHELLREPPVIKQRRTTAASLTGGQWLYWRIT